MLDLTGFDEIGPRQAAVDLLRARALSAVEITPGAGTTLLLRFDSGAVCVVRPRATEAAGSLGSLAFFWKDAP